MINVPRIGETLLRFDVSDKASSRQMHLPNSRMDEMITQLLVRSLNKKFLTY
jgi:hypothetical protein